MSTLYIDTTKPLQVTVRLDKAELIKQYDSPREQNVLTTINQLLEQEKITTNSISEIKVNPGPGTFTGTRVGVAVANALAFALNLKVNSQTPPVLPIYAEPPHITKPKSS